MNEAGYLLDTNVVCEFMKGKKANPATMEWLRKHRDCRLYVSVISFGQIRRGVEALRHPVCDCRTAISAESGKTRGTWKLCIS